MTESIAAAALIYSDEDRLLLLQPTYKPGWTLPGGRMEPGESPLEACLRELREETGIRRTTGALRCIDVRRSGGTGRGLRLLFDLEPATAGELRDLQLPPDEILDFALARPLDAVELLDAPQGRRLATILDHPGEVLYLEDGELPASTR